MLILIKINGRFFVYNEEMTVYDAAKNVNLNPDFYTIIINGQIVPKNDYTSYKIKDEDEIDIIFMMSGG
jgi:sulfur carrier protein